MCIQHTNFSDDECENMCTLSYNHQQIVSITHLPLFRIRSWKNWLCHMSLIFLHLHKKTFGIKLTKLDQYPGSKRLIQCPKHRKNSQFRIWMMIKIQRKRTMCIFVVYTVNGLQPMVSLSLHDPCSRCLLGPHGNRDVLPYCDLYVVAVMVNQQSAKYHSRH